MNEFEEDFPKSIGVITMGRAKGRTGNVKTSKQATAVKRDAAKPASQHEAVPPTETATRREPGSYIYNSYIVFVDDPKLKQPFTVLQGSNIQCLDSKKYINDHFLSDNRRRRRFDLAFTNLFTFPCRVFAKSENSNNTVKLHKIVVDLNRQFSVLLSCGVDVDTAYEKMLLANPRKVKDGIIYETGELENGPDTALLYDTPPSLSDGCAEDNPKSTAEDDKASVEDDMALAEVRIYI